MTVSQQNTASAKLVAELRTKAQQALDDFIGLSFVESRLILGDTSVSAALKKFDEAVGQLGEAEKQSILDAVDERESHSRGDIWQVFKSIHPELWNSFDREAILRVANAMQFDPQSESDVVCNSEFDGADMYEWVLKRAKDGVFGWDDLNIDLTRRQRRQAVKYWCFYPETEKQAAIDDGTVDDEFLAAMELLKKWEKKPLRKWKYKTFRQVITARVGLRLGETDNPKSSALKIWQVLSDDRKQQLADYGIVDREFLDAMNQLERWANGNHQGTKVTDAANQSEGVEP